MALWCTLAYLCDALFTCVCVGVISQMFALLLNFDPSQAPAHSSLCVSVGAGSCISEATSFRQEANIISTPDSFMANEFGSDKVPCAALAPLPPLALPPATLLFAGKLCSTRCSSFWVPNTPLPFAGPQNREGRSCQVWRVAHGPWRGQVNVSLTCN